jgi:predicted ribosome quality control (RQC) complex YloA/Tae2 family protein
MRREIYNETEIIIGGCAEENWEIIDFESEEIWMHLNSFPSCHVIIKDVNAEEELLRYAGGLCKKNTRYKNIRNIKICYTRCNNLEKGEAVGSVMFKSKRKVRSIVV